MEPSSSGSSSSPTIIEQQISRFLEDVKAKDPILSDFIEYLKEINDNNDIKAIFGLLYAPIAMELEDSPSMKSGIRNPRNPAKSLLKKFLDSKLEELDKKNEKLLKLKGEFSRLTESFDRNQEKFKIPEINTNSPEALRRKALIEGLKKIINDKKLNLVEEEKKFTEEKNRYLFITSINVNENTPEERSHIMNIYLNFIQRSGVLEIESTSSHSDFIITYLKNLIKYQGTINFNELEKISYRDDEGNNNKIIISNAEEYLGKPNTVTIRLSPWVICEGKTPINTEFNEYGTFYYSNGSIYEGELKDSKKHGEGILYYSNGSKYKGEWNDDQKHGKGILYYPDGSKKYEGEWKEGKKHGKGISYYPDESKKYDGDWEKGKKHGKGILYNPDESKKYEGEWKNNKRNGKGTAYYTNGSRYEGEWKDNKTNGKGILYYPNGSRYEGEWIDGKKHGKGIIEHQNGDRFEEEWLNGKIIKSIKLDPANPDNGIEPTSASQLGKSTGRKTADTAKH